MILYIPGGAGFLPSTVGIICSHVRSVFLVLTVGFSGDPSTNKMDTQQDAALKVLQQLQSPLVFYEGFFRLFDMEEIQL